MKRFLAIAVILAQAGVLAFMAGEREWIVRTGKTLYLRTAPIDPRDPMRGDYVRFNFEAARIPARLCSDGVLAWFKPDRTDGYRELRDRVVYVQIGLDDEGVAKVTRASDRRPSEGLFLRARSESVADDILTVRFGTEALFMQQGKAVAFEKAARDRAGVPVEVEVAVSAGGTAVLKTYRWAPLGLTVELDRPPRPTTPAAPDIRTRAEPTLLGATLQLKNHSDHAVAIVVRPDRGSFRLVRNERWPGGKFVWVGEKRELTKPSGEMVRVLPPGGVYREHLDLLRPEWFVHESNPKGGTAPLAIGSLVNEWGSPFRFEYVAATKAECVGLPHADEVWHGRLQSRAFGPAGGGVD